MNTSTIEARGGVGKRLGVLFLGLAVALAGTLAFAGGQAKAAEQTITFDKGLVNLGFAFQNREILPAPQNIGASTLPDLWDARATQSTPGTGTPPNTITSFKPVGCLTQYTFRVVSPGPPLVVAQNDGQEGRPLTLNPDYPCDPNPPNGTAVVDVAADGTFTGEANDFQFPIMIVPNPLDGSPVPISLSAPEGIVGEIDSATGDVRIDGPMQVQVLTGLQTNPLGSYCALDLPGREPGGFNPSQPIPDGGFALTTDYSLPVAQGYAGTPYTTGLEGDGALVGTWNTTEDSISVGGANCATVNSVSKGFGGIWLSSGIDAPAAFPTCADFGLAGTFADCVEAVASIGTVTVSGPGNAKRGKTATWKVRIPNTGTATATGVRTSVSGRGVKVNTPVATIAPGATRTETIKAKLTRAGKFTLTVKVTSANAGSKTVKRTVTVK